MTSACFSRGHTGFSRNATLVATVNPPALAGGVFNGKDDGAGDIVGLPQAAGLRRCSCGRGLRHGKSMKGREQEHFLLPAFLLRALGC